MPRRLHMPAIVRIGTLILEKEPRATIAYSRFRAGAGSEAMRGSTRVEIRAVSSVPAELPTLLGRATFAVRASFRPGSSSGLCFARSRKMRARSVPAVVRWGEPGAAARCVPPKTAARARARPMKLGSSAVEVGARTRVRRFGCVRSGGFGADNLRGGSSPSISLRRLNVLAIPWISDGIDGSASGS